MYYFHDKSRQATVTVVYGNKLASAAASITWIERRLKVEVVCYDIVGGVCSGMPDSTKNTDKRRVGGTCYAEVNGIQAVGPRDVTL